MNGRYLLLVSFLLALAACQGDQVETAATATSVQDSSLNSQTADATSTPSHLEGAKTHQEKCSGCHMVPHDAAFYQRPERKMKSYERLQSQVRLCNSNLNLELFDEDMTLIGEYLNESYYKFSVN